MTPKHETSAPVRHPLWKLQQNSYLSIKQMILFACFQVIVNF